MAIQDSMLIALFKWLNQLLGNQVTTLDDISSGLNLWKLLQDVDPKGFADDLPCRMVGSAPMEAWPDKLRNLEHIHTALTLYIRGICRRKLPLPLGEPDLEAVAKVASEKDATQFLKLVFLAVIFGRFSMDYIQELTSFSEEHQTQFYLILQEAEALEDEKSPLSSTAPAHSDHGDTEDASSSVGGREQDHELIYEQRLAELVAVNKGLQTETFQLQEQLENLHDQHTKLQKSYDNIEVAHKGTSERLEALRSGKGDQSMVSIQRTKMQQQETVIATFESKIASLQQEHDRFESEKEALSSQLEDFQQMQDQVFELTDQQEQLQRRANTADEYKEKVQRFLKVDDENEALKFRVAEMQRQLKESDSDQASNSDLRRENDEMRRLVSNIEQELSESIELKKRAEVEKMTLEARLQLADGQATRWKARVETLQKRLLEQPGPESPSTPRATTTVLSPDAAVNGDDASASSGQDTSSKVSESPTEDQNVITEQELQSIISAMKAHTRGTQTDRTSSIQAQQKHAIKMEQLAADSKDIKKLQQPIDRSALMAALRAELESSTNGTPAEPNDDPRTITQSQQQPSGMHSDHRLDAALMHNTNLERELQLMASAWYDQNTRLMASSAGGFISRGRARPEPNSFLGRQRRLVDGLLTGKS